eukprot:GEMP01048721.1.p1 GENE.GEMP01048721.1~~GEMP01048721.1.p1  ORF type:complete len:237 (+),score=51.51 GEMP01048721.1:126-836(+)
MVCFSCGALDHMRRDCPSRAYNCHICSQEGHFARNCPDLVSKDVPGVLVCSRECFPRHFILFCPLFCRSPDPLQGRQDLVARCVTQAFFRSRGVRHNVVVSIVADSTWQSAIRVEGRFLHLWKPDESSVRTRLKDISPTPFTFPEECYLLDEEGETMEDVLRADRAAPTSAGLTFILGDHQGLQRDDFAQLESRSQVHRLSLGGAALLGSSCIAITHYLLDKIHQCPSRLWAEKSN